MKDAGTGDIPIPDTIEELREQYAALLKTNNSLNERVLELYTLYNVSRTLSASLQVSDLFDLVVGLIRESLNVDQYCLMFLDNVGELFIEVAPGFDLFPKPAFSDDPVQLWAGLTFAIR